MVRNQSRGRRHDRNVSWITSSGFGAFLDEANAPLDQVRIGELQDNAIGDSASEFEHFGSVSRNPHWRNAASCPRQPRFPVLVSDLLAAREIAKIFYRLLQLRHRDGLF